MFDTRLIHIRVLESRYGTLHIGQEVEWDNNKYKVTHIDDLDVVIERELKEINR